MPHSSGGGSHSGGSHHSSSGSSFGSSSGSSSGSRSSGGGSHSGGSHYSSGSSSYSGSSGYSGSSRLSGSSGSRFGASYGRNSHNPKIRSEHFAGSRQYVRYRNNRAEYVFADSDPTNYSGGILWAAGRRILKVIAGINIFMLVMVAIAGIYLATGKDPIDAVYDKTILIDDQADVLGSTEELEESLLRFQKQTGVTPAVITVNNEAWESYYDALEYYAMDLYVNSFEDEYHWLIVYSEPAEVLPDFNDWYFEGILGDDTDSMVTSTMMDNFTDTLQKGLTRNATSVEQAITDAFDEATEYAESIMASYSGWEILILFIPFAILVAVPIAIIKGVNKLIAGKYKGYVTVMVNEPQRQTKRRPGKQTGEKPQRQENQSDENPRRQEKQQKMKNCEYCNSLYIVGTISECPHCGAPIPADNS